MDFSLSKNLFSICCLIQMNHSTEETARYFNGNPGSMQQARVRLEKKLNFPGGKSLFNF